MDNPKLQAFILMKVGNHAGEDFEQILERKRQELVNAGRIFWGYGGNTCNPITQVQPFARLHVKKHGSICLLMEPINSNAIPEILPAIEYSEDGVNWKPIPDGINVTGSRYALILDEIEPSSLELNVDEYIVGIGPSRGKRASEYIKGRVDKACLTREAVTFPHPANNLKQVQYFARMKEPFGVMLR